MRRKSAPTKHAKATTRRGRRPSRSDWARVDATTEAEIAEQIAGDADTAPEFTDEMLARARWKPGPEKQSIAIRVDQDVLDFFRSFGPGYQTRMTQVLRVYVDQMRASRKKVATKKR